MDSDTTITRLIAELTSLDTSLREDEASLRVLLSHMLTEKPHITVDAAFARALREKLLRTSPHTPIPSPYETIETWVFRFIPLGCACLLFVLLMPPEAFRAPTDETIAALEHDITERNAYILDARSGGTAYTYQNERGGGQAETSSAPSLFGSAPMSKSALMDSPSIEVMGVPPKDGDTRIAPSLVETSIRVESLRVRVPSFVVVYGVTEEGMPGIIAVSPLLLPGTIETLTLHTTTAADTEHLIHATLYLDSGDRYFSEYEDEPVLDADGQPIAIDITVLP